MPVRAKICGLTSPEAVDAAAAGGAGYFGFNFVPRSPRFVPGAAAAALAGRVPPGRAKVGLWVDAADEEIAAVLARVPLDMIQLHGRESPQRVADVKARFGLPVIRAIGIATVDDLPELERQMAVADMVIADAKPAPGAAIPGGNGVPFDWRLIAHRRWPVPWMLAGGLVPENVAEAVLLTGARQVDVSSGVESAPGVKDPARIAAFLATCAAL